jgi:hypothetical protein
MLLNGPEDDMTIIRTWLVHPWARWMRWGDGLLCPSHVATLGHPLAAG